MKRYAFLALFAAATAQPTLAAQPFFEQRAAVTDQVLESNHGTGSWQLTVGGLAQLSNGDSANYLQWVARSARTQMDVWWGSVGSELIAESVRSGG